MWYQAVGPVSTCVRAVETARCAKFCKLQRYISAYAAHLDLGLIPVPKARTAEACPESSVGAAVAAMKPADAQKQAPAESVLAVEPVAEEECRSEAPGWTSTPAAQHADADKERQEWKGDSRSHNL